MQAIFTLLAVPIFILNFAGGIVGGIWLAILGDWPPLIMGIGAWIISTLSISLVLSPGLIFEIPAAMALERGNYVLGGLLALLGNLWTYGIMIVWCVGSFVFILAEHKSGSPWPYLLWAYSIATGPWGYLASREAQSDSNSLSSIVAFCACIGVVAMMGVMLFARSLNLAYLVFAFAIPMTISFVFQTLIFISIARMQRRSQLSDRSC
jgi:hypothetical protein